MKIDHLGIAVRSLAEAERLYTEVLGLPVTHREVLERDAVSTAFISLGDTHIELLEPTREDSPVGRFLSQRGEGVHHVAIEVQDVAAILARSRAAGFRLVDEAPRSGAGGTRVAFLHPRSTQGVLIEFVERTR